MSQGKSNRRIGMALAGLVFGMVGLSFAAVPLYQIFCQVTGYGGTTQVADAAPEVILDREITIRFDANMAPDLAWDFDPAQVSQTLNVGEVGLAFYNSTNLSDHATTGIATFNVTPLDVGIYFKKIQCFCFNEQTLEGGETALMPVYFYVDPAIADEPRLDHVTTITLSYTFFSVESPQASTEVTPREVAGVANNANMGHTGP